MRTIVASAVWPHLPVRVYSAPAGHMASNLAGAAVLRFGVFELAVKTGELRKTGMLMALPPQPFGVLALLASHSGELVTREDIQQEIWGSETFVDFEQGLNFAIRKIRAALGDDAENPRYIETLPRRGYRFIAPVEGIALAAAGLPQVEEPARVMDFSGTDEPRPNEQSSPLQFLPS